ncbi:Hsp70 family protein [Paenarthrobacter sp. NPDC018779]|uniref:Hsp70 family protein n=1 Tax=Paenarthrobacter sp. NPDC018779 TaxID=3364375 RepID=UPI0037C94B5C
MRHAMFFFEVTMSYVLAIDVGTSFTAAAVLRPGQGSTSAPEVLPLGLHGSAVPSVLYYAEDGRVLVGEAAERRGLDDPRRMVREFKRRIGDSVPLAVGDDWLAPEDVFAALAQWVVAKAEEREGGPASSIVMTHPASWGQHRTSVVLAALNLAGLGDIRLISEPEAAALHYASQTRVEDGSTIAVYDLGGGTFDTAILRKAGANRFELIGHPDGIETLGGADFDAAVLRHVVAHLGDAVQALDADHPATLSALSRLKRECREAKEALSLDSETSISVALPGRQQAIRLVRSEFEAMIEPQVQDTLDALGRSLEAVHVDPEDLTAVLLIGGSSRIPLVAELVSAELERPVAVDADPKSSICLGAAISASSALAASPAVSSGSAAPTADGRTADSEAAAVEAGLTALAGHRTRGMSPVARPGVGHGRTALSALKQAAAGTSKAGRHAPRSRMRMTAAAAAAATVLTIVTATAAQTPEGAGLLSVFAAQGSDVMRDGGTKSGGGQAGAASGAKAGEAPAAGQTGKGLDASARTGTARTSTGSGQKGATKGAPAAGSGAAPAAGNAAAPATGNGTTAPAQGTPGATTPGTPTSAPAPGTVTPTPTPTGGAASGPAPEPTPTPTQPPVTTPADPPPTTVPDPVTPTPEPTTQAPPPPPPVTQDPVPSDPVTEQAPPPPPTETSPGETPAPTAVA